jgi:hypothetical protein
MRGSQNDMRKTRNLDKERQRILQTQFPDIIEQVYGWEDDMPGYRWLALSVFESWLPKEKHHLIDDVSEETHAERLKILYAFTRKLASTTEVLTFRIKGRDADRPVFKEFTIPEAAILYCESSTELTPRNKLFVIVLPEYDCVIKESRDYTNHVYYRSEELLKPVLGFAREAGLYMLREKNKNEY